MMQILGLFGMYFDAAVVFVTNSSLLFRLAMAILWHLSGEVVQVKNLNANKCNRYIICGYPLVKEYVLIIFVDPDACYIQSTLRFVSTPGC